MNIPTQEEALDEAMEAVEQSAQGILKALRVLRVQRHLASGPLVGFITASEHGLCFHETLKDAQQGNWKEHYFRIVRVEEVEIVHPSKQITMP